MVLKNERIDELVADMSDYLDIQFYYDGIRKYCDVSDMKEFNCKVARYVMSRWWLFSKNN